eukprot:1712825-Amphidinium_carterae.2
MGKQPIVRVSLHIGWVSATHSNRTTVRGCATTSVTFFPAITSSINATVYSNGTSRCACASRHRHGLIWAIRDP